MFSEHAIDVIKIAIEYFMITLFIIFAALFIDIRNQYANALNEQYIVSDNTKQRLKYSKYITGKNQDDVSECVTADVVLECVRDYRDGQILIYIDKLKDDSAFLLDSSSTDFATQFQQASVSNMMTKLDLVSAKYHPYLMYDNDPVTGPYSESGYEVTGIAFIRYEAP